MSFEPSVGAGPGPETRGRPLVWLGEVDNARSRAERHRVRDLVVGAVTGHSSHALVIGQRCPSCGSPAHGPPTVAEPAGWHVSTATAGALMAVAVHRDPIGVDVEPAGRLDGSNWADLVRVVPGLQALRDRLGAAADLVDVWTATEALGKAIERGLEATPAELAVGLDRFRLVHASTSTEPGRRVAVAVDATAATPLYWGPAA